MEIVKTISDGLQVYHGDFCWQKLLLALPKIHTRANDSPFSDKIGLTPSSFKFRDAETAKIPGTHTIQTFRNSAKCIKMQGDLGIFRVLAAILGRVKFRPDLLVGKGFWHPLHHLRQESPHLVEDYLNGNRL